MTVITNDYEAFLFMKDHLLSQMEKAWDSNEDCVYRGYKTETLEDVRESAKDHLEGGIWAEDEYEVFYELLSNTPYDAKCAVGCLIIDDFYDQNLEGNVIQQNANVWDSVRKSNPVWKMTDGSYNLMRNMQNIHDNNPTDDWANLMEKLEKDFNEYKDYVGECND